MSGREWKPGDVAMVTNQAGQSGRAIRFLGSPEDGWFAERDGIGGDIADARPLVVIDPEDREQVERLADAFVVAADPRESTASQNGVRAMQAALREVANPTPKPEEPTGLGAVVEDAQGKFWVLVYDHSMWQRHDDRDVWTTYDRIDVVRVHAEGWSA